MKRSAPNLPIALSSLVLSVMLWFVVYAQTVPDPRPVNVPLAIDGLDDSRFFPRKIPTDLRLVVNAPADRAKELADERVTASVDLSSAVVGIHDYPVSVSPDWVRRYLDDRRPKVRVEIEPIAKRVVPVMSVVKGAIKDRNLQLKGRTLSPAQVTLRGPASEVASVQEVRAYVDLTEIGAANQEPQETELVILDARGSRPQHVRINPSMAVSTFKLVAAAATKTAEVVPDLSDVTYHPGFLPGGFRLDPEVVTISGKPATLTNVSKVPTEIVALHGVNRSRTVRVRLLAPAGTTIVGKPVVELTVLVLPAPAPPRVSSPLPPAPSR